MKIWDGSTLFLENLSTYTVTRISLDRFSLGNHIANQLRLIPVTVYTACTLPIKDDGSTPIMIIRFLRVATSVIATSLYIPILNVGNWFCEFRHPIKIDSQNQYLQIMPKHPKVIFFSSSWHFCLVRTLTLVPRLLACRIRTACPQHTCLILVGVIALGKSTKHSITIFYFLVF